MWKYEYKRAFITDDDLEEQCNTGGQIGWRLRFQRWDESRAEWDCFFERIKTAREQFYESLRRPITEAEHAEIVAALAHSTPAGDGGHADSPA